MSAPPDPVFVPGRPADPALVVTAAAVLANGGSDDDAARAVLAQTRSPIEAIRAIRALKPSLSLAEAKPLVHRNLPPDVRENAERLWDAVERDFLA